MFPLLGQAFRIDVGVPDHQRGDERVRHFAASQRNIGEASITQISLTHVDAIVDFRKRAWYSVTSIVAVPPKRDIRRTITGAGFQSDTKKPIVCQRSTQTDPQAIPFAFTLLPVMPPSNARGRCSQWLNATCFTAAIFVTQSSVAIEFEFSDRGGELPFPGGGGRNFLCQFGTDLLGFLIRDDLFSHEQIEESARILPACGQAAQH